MDSNNPKTVWYCLAAAFLAIGVALIITTSTIGGALMLVAAALFACSAFAGYDLYGRRPKR